MRSSREAQHSDSVLSVFKFHSQAQAVPIVFEFIEGWYNAQRRHSALGQISPLAFEGGTRIRRSSPQTMASTEPPGSTIMFTSESQVGAGDAKPRHPRSPMIRKFTRPRNRGNSTGSLEISVTQVLFVASPAEQLKPSHGRQGSAGQWRSQQDNPKRPSGMTPLGRFLSMD